MERLSDPTIDACTMQHLDDWSNLRAELWPDGGLEEHRQFATAALEDAGRMIAFIALSKEGTALGFAEASLRFDYVNGCCTSPVGFLEGLYVREIARRQGVARQLVKAVDQWAIGRGCTELASDALLENEAAHDVHRRIGFCETERVVYFHKALEAPAG